MKTLAPEFSALTIILRSTGPVISTRRSSRSAGIGATRQSPSRIAGSRPENPASRPRRTASDASARRASNSRRRASKLRCSSARKARAAGVRISSKRGPAGRERRRRRRDRVRWKCSYAVLFAASTRRSARRIETFCRDVESRSLQEIRRNRNSSAKSAASGARRGAASFSASRRPAMRVRRRGPRARATARDRGSDPRRAAGR